MDNRDRDKMNKSTGSTGDINKNKSQDVDRSKQSGSDAEFGRKIDSSKDLENEPSRKSGDLGSSSSDIKGSMGSKDSSGNSGRH